MKKVLFVNNPEPNCGVHSYAKRVFDVFSRSLKYDVAYCEPTDVFGLLRVVFGMKADIIIYNHLAQTMSWLTHPDIDRLRAIGIKQGLLVHNLGYSACFDFYLPQDPRHPQEGCHYPLLRPLFNRTQTVTLEARRIPQIGTFGFALPEKNYPRICELVNEQFDEAEIRMHLTISHFRPNLHWLNEIQGACSRAIKKPGIKLTITSDFRDDDAILDFLAGNDLNVFLYHNFPHYNGLSSTIDYALSVPVPISVCKSGLFSHINDTVPSICVEDSTLPDIIKNGLEPTRKFREAWKPENFVKHLEGILDSL